MKIYSMTATFGKLSHQTLTLKPGLNVVTAPNEWGKSTWCAFVVAMLYGINTREQTKTGFLADKEHYTPWSGEPMSGRMDLNWNGRDITIERRSKGRGFFNDFKAYETESGIAVEELTAANCGSLLLGVEQSVFTRAGFLRQSDMAVTADEKLRTRLNALVTTADESTDGDDLARKLKELKNRCRFNKTGLLPQAESQREELRDKLNRLETLRGSHQNITRRQQELEQYRRTLENHKAALAWEAAGEHAKRLEEARAKQQIAVRQVELLLEDCRNLPTPEQAESELAQLRQLREKQEELNRRSRLMPPPPQMPPVPEPFRGMEPEEAVRDAQVSERVYQEDKQALLKGGRWLPALPALAGVLLLILLWEHWWALAAGVICLGAAAIWLRSVAADRRRRENTMHTLEQRYKPLSPGQWVEAAQRYAQTQQTYTRDLETCRENLSRLQTQMQEVEEQLVQFTGGGSVSQRETELLEVGRRRRALEEAQREARHFDELTRTLEDGCWQVSAPAFPDQLTLPAGRTEEELNRTALEQARLLEQLGVVQGQIQALGQKETLERQLQQVQQRVDKLENIYQAAVYAMQVQQAATQELQRRFAPRISQRAQQIMGRLTDGRYDRILLDNDLHISSGAQGEDTLRDNLWRSSGTADQLYFALRLAVAEELTPNAPLLLDDALVRFDDTRMAAAINVLREYGQDKQVILFTCQNREETYIKENVL